MHQPLLYAPAAHFIDGFLALAFFAAFSFLQAKRGRRATSDSAFRQRAHEESAVALRTPLALFIQFRTPTYQSFDRKMFGRTAPPGLAVGAAAIRVVKEKSRLPRQFRLIAGRHKTTRDPIRNDFR
jgi:hypothetical protein